MKRADQHNVLSSSPIKENQEFLQAEPTGVDMPSEKDIPLPEQQDTPSMGALPVDTLGKTKTNDDWETIALDETHSGKNEAGDSNNDNEDFIATGVGPGPEDTDN